MLMLCLLAGVASATSAQTPALDTLRSRFEQGEVFQAHFEHRYADSYTGKEQASEGEIWVNNKMYKVKTKHQRVVVDGETSKVYDEQRNRVIISNYDPQEDDFAPSRMLQGADTAYTFEQEQASNNISIVMKADDPFAVFRQLRMLVGPDYIPIHIEATDQADNHMKTQFKNGRFIPLSDDIFQLSYPSDAEIVDMRD